MQSNEGQLGFDTLLLETDRINEKAAFERQFGHLPSTIKEALPYMRTLIERHHAKMIKGDSGGAIAIRREAHELALRLNNGEPGIIAGDDAPGCVLSRKTAARKDAIPLWGQEGCFTIEVGGTQIRIEMDGMFGIGATSMYWLGFSAHAVETCQPFISGTGYRSFLGINAPLLPSLTVDGFVREVVDAHIRKELKGKLVSIEERYRRG
jgi:hypothetical protein